MGRVKTYMELFEAFDYNGAGFRGYNQIILIAPKGSGKTAIGEWLADRINASFIDMDESIEMRHLKRDVDTLYDKAKKAGHVDKDSPLLTRFGMMSSENDVIEARNGEQLQIVKRLLASVYNQSAVIELSSDVCTFDETDMKKLKRILAPYRNVIFIDEHPEQYHGKQSYRNIDGETEIWDPNKDNPIGKEYNFGPFQYINMNEFGVQKIHLIGFSEIYPYSEMKNVLEGYFESSEYNAYVHREPHNIIELNVRYPENHQTKSQKETKLKKSGGQFLDQQELLKKHIALINKTLEKTPDRRTEVNGKATEAYKKYNSSARQIKRSIEYLRKEDPENPMLDFKIPAFTRPKTENFEINRNENTIKKHIDIINKLIEENPDRKTSENGKFTKQYVKYTNSKKRIKDAKKFLREEDPTNLMIGIAIPTYMDEKIRIRKLIKKNIAIINHILKKTPDRRTIVDGEVSKDYIKYRSTALQVRKSIESLRKLDPKNPMIDLEIPAFVKPKTESHKIKREEDLIKKHIDIINKLIEENPDRVPIENGKITKHYATYNNSLARIGQAKKFLSENDPENPLIDSKVPGFYTNLNKETISKQGEPTKKGRPRGSTNKVKGFGEYTKPDTDTTEEPATKRGKGRPKGSTNKVKGFDDYSKTTDTNTDKITKEPAKSSITRKSELELFDELLTSQKNAANAIIDIEEHGKLKKWMRGEEAAAQHASARKNKFESLVLAKTDITNAVDLIRSAYPGSPVLNAISKMENNGIDYMNTIIGKDSDIEPVEVINKLWDSVGGHIPTLKKKLTGEYGNLNRENTLPRSYTGNAKNIKIIPGKKQPIKRSTKFNNLSKSELKDQKTSHERQIEKLDSIYWMLRTRPKNEMPRDYTERTNQAKEIKEEIKILKSNLLKIDYIMKKEGVIEESVLNFDEYSKIFESGGQSPEIEKVELSPAALEYQWISNGKEIGHMLVAINNEKKEASIVSYMKYGKLSERVGIGYDYIVNCVNDLLKNGFDVISINRGRNTKSTAIWEKLAKDYNVEESSRDGDACKIIRSDSK